MFPHHEPIAVLPSVRRNSFTSHLPSCSPKTRPESHLFTNGHRPLHQEPQSIMRRPRSKPTNLLTEWIRFREQTRGKLIDPLLASHQIESMTAGQHGAVLRFITPGAAKSHRSSTLQAHPWRESISGGPREHPWSADILLVGGVGWDEIAQKRKIRKIEVKKMFLKMLKIVFMWNSYRINTDRQQNYGNV